MSTGFSTHRGLSRSEGEGTQPPFALENKRDPSSGRQVRVLRGGTQTRLLA